MKYEYDVQTIGTSVMYSLEDIGEALQEALNDGETQALMELGWELWQTQTLSDAATGGNNGLILIFRKPIP